MSAMSTDFVERLARKWCPSHGDAVFVEGNHLPICSCQATAAAICEALEEARKAIEMDDVLLLERNRLVDLLPCPTHGPGCVPFAVEEVERLQQRVKGLQETLKASTRPHLVVDEDCWFSCPQSGECCRDDQDKNKCDCGADEHNARIEAALRGEK